MHSLVFGAWFCHFCSSWKLWVPPTNGLTHAAACHRMPPRPLLSGWLILYRGGGGWVGQGPKKSLCTLNRPPSSGPFDTFHFFPEEKFSDVGGWVGQPKSRGANLTPPPPPVSLSKGLMPPHAAAQHVFLGDRWCQLRPPTREPPRTPRSGVPRGARCPECPPARPGLPPPAHGRCQVYGEGGLAGPEEAAACRRMLAECFAEVGTPEHVVCVTGSFFIMRAMRQALGFDEPCDPPL